MVLAPRDGRSWVPMAVCVLVILGALALDIIPEALKTFYRLSPEVAERHRFHAYAQEKGLGAEFPIVVAPFIKDSLDQASYGRVIPALQSILDNSKTFVAGRAVVVRIFGSALLRWLSPESWIEWCVLGAVVSLALLVYGWRTSVWHQSKQIEVNAAQTDRLMAVYSAMHAPKFHTSTTAGGGTSLEEMD